MEAEEIKLRVPSLLWIPLIICVALLYFVDIFQINYYSISPSMSSFSDIKSDEKALVGFAINTPGCRIPDMDPFDEHVRQFINTPKMPKCNKGIPALFESNLTSIYLVNSALASYNVTDISELKCCYWVFWRKDPKNDENDDKISYSTECFNFTDTAYINNEFIEVTCAYENSTIYRDMFSFVPLKNTTALTVPNNPRPLSVLVIGLDAVSRLNLHRQMPNTLSYLKELEAVELLGYNKVGDNTFPNLIPVLTGLFEEDLKKKCWPKQKDHFDKCHFIWHDYKSKGYVTGYGEDSSWMGLFNYLRRGFLKQSTDYGYSYFNRKSESTLGNSHNMNVNECVGARLVYRDLLDYVKKFTTTMDKHELPYFGFFWGVSLSHDYLNKPKLGDEDYTLFFKSLKDGGHLENTALIFMSDHGIRWGGIRQTYQGRMEERLPFVIMILPEWYRTRYKRAYSNLRRNIRKLTTPFDLHQTFVDLLHPFELTDEYLELSNTKSKGISLFREISKERTCEDAGITNHWCTCQQSTEVDRNSTEVITAADLVVKYINQALDGYAQCANLSVDVVLNARLMMHNEQIYKGDNKIQDYMLTIRTIPGEAIFEVTVRYRPKDHRYDVMGTISRLNLYGKQSACITEFHLKLYCYCKNLL